MVLLPLVGTILLIIQTVTTSPGDRLLEFKDCCYSCEYTRSCPNSSINYIDLDTNEYAHYKFENTPELLSRFLFWDCISDCDYQCQQIITKERISNGEKIYQFHGKWPFMRLFGVQEFFSSIFSVGNFLPHYYGYHKINRRLKDFTNTRVMSDRYQMLQLLVNYRLVSICGMMAWAASTIFHFRDLPVTENLDYFFAGLTVLSGFYALFIRAASLYSHSKLHLLFTWCMALIFGLHILRLYVDWSYTYNMRFNIFFGILEYLLLLLLALQNYRELKGVIHTTSSDSNHKGYKSLFQKRMFNMCVLPVAMVVFTSFAMSFELFDIFLYRWQVDSHALWHLFTIGPSFLLYDFFVEDTNHLNRDYIKLML